jgi:hypothetical protein
LTESTVTVISGCFDALLPTLDRPAMRASRSIASALRVSDSVSR